MPVADEIGFEGRMTPILVLRRRSSRAHAPARLGSAGIGASRETQKKGRDAVAFRAERDPTACHQIENFRLSRNFDHNGAQRGTTQRVRSSPHAADRIGDTQKKNACRIKTQFEQSRCAQLAEFERGEILPYPENVLAPGETRSQARREPRGCRLMTGGGEHLMQASAH